MSRLLALLLCLLPAVAIVGRVIGTRISRLSSGVVRISNCAAALLCLLHAVAWAQATTTSITQPATLTVTIGPVLSGVNFATSLPCQTGTTTACTAMTLTSGPNNAGTKIADISVVTNPPGGSTAGVTLSIASCTQQPGATTCTPGDGSAQCCVLTSTTLPASVDLLATDVPAAIYRFAVTATMPAAGTAMRR